MIPGFDIKVLALLRKIYDLIISTPPGSTSWGFITGTLSNQDDLQDALDAKVPYTEATADVDLGVYKLSADAVEFSLTPTNAPGAGQVAYDGASGSLSYLMNSSDVVCHIGQQLFAYVKNAEAVTITKGQPVYLYQASGNKATIKLAYNTSDAGSAKTLGLAAEDITSNQNGFVICQGVLSGINTGSYNEGDTLYLGDTAGTLTATKPYAPNHLVYIGVVEKANNGAGQIYVRPQNGYELNEIHDVQVGTYGTKDILWRDTATNLWKNIDVFTLIGASSSSADGYLTSTNWSTFNSKQDPITLTTTGTSGAATLVGSTLNIPNYSTTFVSQSILNQNHGGVSIAGNTTNAGGWSGATTLAAVANEFARNTIIPVAGTLKNWAINVGNQPSTGNLVFTLRVNSVNTAMTITIAAFSLSGKYYNTTTSVSVAQGDLVSFQAQNNASTASGTIVTNSIMYEI